MSDATVLPDPGGTAVLAGRPVARLGYGVMQLAERPGRDPVDREDAIALLRRAVAAGVNHLDTAQFYGDGTANAFLREALHPYDDDLLLVSKVGATADPGGPVGLVLAQQPAQLRAQVEANLRTLDVERLAVVNLRRGDAPPGLVAEGDQVVDLDDQLAELVALRDEGKIGGIGLSNVSVEQLRRALPVGVVCVQNAYHLLDRTAEPVLACCAEHGVAWVPFFPLGSGFPGTRRVTEEPAVRRAAEALGATPAQVGLAWLLAHDRGTLLIPGTASAAHLAENLASADVVLDPETRATLDALAPPA